MAIQNPDYPHEHVDTLDKHSFKNCGGKVARRVWVCQETGELIEVIDRSLTSSIPKITVYDDIAASTVKEHTFVNELKKFTIKTEKVVDILYNYDGSNDFATITSGGVLKEVDLVVSGLKIYFKTAQANIPIEIVEWR